MSTSHMLSAIVLSALLSTGSVPAPPAIVRLRPLSTAARALVADAARRSPTIARLLNEIEHSDAIVYVELQLDLKGEGATTLFAVNGYGRFIRVAIAMTLPGFRRIEMLGHELRHAIEITRAPEVRDSAGMRRLFTTIGWVLPDLTFETDAAIDTERQVRQELRALPLKRY